jgi:hypothetical protein
VRGSAAFFTIALGCASADAAHAYPPIVNYQLQCMGCHLGDGSGQPGRVPSIRRSLVTFSMVREGRAFVVRVPGVAQSPLSNEDTAVLLNWMVRNLSDLAIPSGFRDYTSAEVGKLRNRPLAQVKAVRARLIQNDGRSGSSNSSSSHNGISGAR